MYGRAVGVEGIDLAVERGECFGFLGPNGAGKTTFIRLALGLIRPTSGRVAVMGHDVARDRMGALAEVGYLPGELGLYPSLAGGRVLDALGRLHPRPPVLRDELLRTLELPASDLRKRVREYSRGMKQKLGLVAALQHDPPLVILDEPTGGLDPVIQGRLLEWLAGRARAGRTVFFSSHVLSEVEELCDRVAMVREGRLLLAGPVEELRRGRSRRVEVRFAEPVEPARYAVDGVGDVEVDGLRHRFTVAGEPRALLAALAALPVEDVAIEPPSLEDAFRHLYGGAAA
jgi:ABC-2 type transport system ATP-binding protein